LLFLKHKIHLRTEYMVAEVQLCSKCHTKLSLG